jgi:hypothetical protein
MSGELAAMCAACASPSDGACTVGMPISRSSSRASATISLVNFEVIVDFEYAAAMSPRAIAAAWSSSYFFFTLRRFATSRAFSAGGAPSNTNTSLSAYSDMRRVVR